MTDQKPSAGRIALVTGASRGIGRAVALGLAQAGAHVILMGRTVGALEEADDEIRAAGGTATLLALDLKATDKLDALGPTILQRWGRLDIFVANAGLLGPLSPLGHITSEAWREVIDVNLTSCFLTLRAVHPHMQRAAWGRIVNISSVTVHLGKENLLHYVASKAGMIGFTRTLAREVGVDGITVNAVTPGAIQTEAELEMFPDQAGIATMLNGLQAVKRRGVPTDIGAAVAFLASEEAGFISGQTINVDGGWAMP